MLALSRGVPLEALILEDDQRAAVEAAWARFPIEQRREAAERLIRLRYRPFVFRSQRSGNRDDRDSEIADLAFTIIDALEASLGPVAKTYPTRGRRRKVKPWTPAEECWEWLLGIAYLRHVLSERKAALENDPLETAVSRDGASKPTSEDCRPLSDTTLDLFANTPDCYFAGTEDEHAPEMPNPPHTRGYGLLYARWPKPSSVEHQPGEKAWLRSLGIEPTPEPDDHDEVNEMQQTQTNEILERLEHLQRTADATFARVAETCERLRDLLPDDEEITAAVDRFLEASL